MKIAPIGTLNTTTAHQEVRFEGEHVSGNLQYSNLDLNRCEFSNVGLKDATFTSCDFRYCRFEDVYFRHAHFRDVDLTGSKFVECNLRRASFSGCDLQYVHFSRCELPYEELISNLRSEPKYRLHGLRVLRLNAESMGDNEWAVKTLRLELRAECEHFYGIVSHKTKYYRDHYNGYARLKYAALWIGHLAQRVFWGYGYRLAPLFAWMVVWIVGWSSVICWSGTLFRTPDGHEERLGWLDAVYAMSSRCTLGSSGYTSVGWLAKASDLTLGVSGAMFIALLAAALYRRIQR